MKFEKLIQLPQLVHIRIQRCSPSPRAFASSALFTLGAMLLWWGTLADANAVRSINYNDQRVIEAINAVLLYLEGSFGALVMVCSGVGAILSAAFGQYRASLGLLVVAIGSFILRSLMSTFFNDIGIQD